jgi:hypothetical protein
MRALLFIAALVAACAAHATVVTDNVIAYECKHLDPKETGYSCAIDKSGYITLTQQEPKDKMSPERRERVHYEFDRFGLRILQLGYSGFFVQTVWGEGKDRLSCARSKKSALYFICQ